MPKPNLDLDDFVDGGKPPDRLPEVRIAGVSPHVDVDAALEEVRARFRVSEGEFHAWYDRFLQMLIHIEPEDITPKMSASFFESAYFLFRAMKDALDVTEGQAEDADLRFADLLRALRHPDPLADEDVLGQTEADGGDVEDNPFYDKDDPSVGSDLYEVLREDDSFPSMKDTEFLDQRIIDLEDFLALDFSLEATRSTGQLGLTYLVDACRSADELAREVESLEGNLEDNILLSRRLERVRQHPSRILAEVMMGRINRRCIERFPSGVFCYGAPLETQLSEFFTRFRADPEAVHTRLGVVCELLLSSRLGRMQEFLTANGKGADASIFVDAERDRFFTELILMLDRFGGLRPTPEKDLPQILSLAFSRLRDTSLHGDRAFFEYVRATRAEAAFSGERSIRNRMEDKIYKSEKCNLPNESAFERLMAPYFQPRDAQERRGQKPPVVAILDLNGFKAVNDKAKPTRVIDPLTKVSQLYHKYALGDEVLYHAGEAMKSVLREGQELFHLHGDEYALILPSETSHEVVLRILAAMQTKLAELARAFDMHHSDTDDFMNLGIAAGFDRFKYGAFDSLRSFLEHIADLMAYAKQDKKTGQYRSFDEKCSYVVGTGFGEASGRYGAQGAFLHGLD